MKFWTKCGKILTEAGKPVLCDNSPCPYYAIFGIKFRWLDQETMEPTNPCSWLYDVQPYEVINNAIIWNSYSSACLPVNRNAGECLRTKIRTGCYDQCDQWDEQTGECTHTTEYCNFCAEVIVYNLTGCYDDFHDFEAVFWGGCGVQPPYPAIWETTYGNKYMTSQASNCVQNYWNKYFCDRYMLNYSITICNMYQWWSIYLKTRYEEIEFCYCSGPTCPGDIIDPGQDCPEGCTKACESYEGDPIDTGVYAVQFTDSFEHGTKVRDMYVPLLQGNEWDCCQENTLLNGADSCNSFYISNISNKNSYTQSSTNTSTCTNSNSCTSFSYKSAPYDNNYGSTYFLRTRGEWKKLILNRTADTPSGATGVKFMATIKQWKRNEGRGRTAENYSESTREFSLNFNQEYTDLPLANYMNGLLFLKFYNCKGDCSYDSENFQEPESQPFINWYWSPEHQWDNDVYTDEVQVTLSGIEYI